MRIFNEEKVEYLVLGGYAVIKYTEPRYTKDRDIWVKPTPENAQRVYEGLAAFVLVEVRRESQPDGWGFQVCSRPGTNQAGD